MNKRTILIAPDSFKACADSVTIAELFKANLAELKNTKLIVKPISDGGDGFLKVCKFYFGGELRYYKIATAYDNSAIECPVLYSENRKEIYIESALVLGLKVVPIHFRNPLRLSSKGLGELLVKIIKDVKGGKIKVENVFIGIGGTATIDMGMGMMSELGLKFFDSKNKEIKVLPENFLKVQVVRYEQTNLPFNIISVIDVTNPLVGMNNGIEIYGRQKGANEEMIDQLIKSFNYLVNLFEYNHLIRIIESLSGAGGGIPSALQIFYKLSPCSSSSFIGRNLGLDEYVSKVDYLITGEGAYDQQSSFGKGAGTLVRLYKNSVKKIFLVCGKISDDFLKGFSHSVYPIELQNFFSSPMESIKQYQMGINLASIKIIKELDF